MVLKWLWPLATLAAMTQTSIYHRKPFGPKMCQKLCTEITGCYAPEFISSYLTCSVINASDIKESSGETRDEDNAKESLACPRYSRKLITRNLQYKCIPKQEMTPEEGTASIHHDESVFPQRILFAPYDNKGQVNYQHFFLNNSENVESYRLTNAQHIYAMAFMASQRRLYICSRGATPGFLNVGDTKVRRMNFGINGFNRCRAIAIDDSRDLVFFAAGCSCQSEAIYKTNLDHRGKFIYTQKNKGALHISLAVDSKSRRIFLLSAFHIKSMSYDGRDEKLIVSGTGYRTMTFDPNNRVLYYNVEAKIMKTSLFTKSETFVTKLNSNPRDMVYFKNRIFIAFLEGGTVGYSDMRNFTILQIWRKQNTRGLVLTLIP